MHAQHDWHRGWNPFWAALGAALLVLVPLVGGTVLLSRQQLSRQLRQAARSQQGVAVQLPRESDRLTVLVCTAGEQPGFVLAYLNASQNGVHLLAVPAGLQVTFADEAAALADCYTAAGPARCRQALMECLPLPEDTRYLALSEAVLERITARYGPVRVGFSGAMTAGELARYGRDSRVQGLSAAEAHGFLTGMDADAVVPQAHRAAARGAVWDAFFRQNLDLLPGALPQALRSVSASLLTDLTALDLDTLDRTLEFLANNEVQIETQVLPGDEQAGRYTLNEESLAAVQSFFNVSPTDGQASSASEP